jgi:hypothetical protein
MPQKRGRGASILLEGDAPQKRPCSERVMINGELFRQLIHEFEELVSELEELLKYAIQVNKCYFK